MLKFEKDWLYKESSIYSWIHDNHEQSPPPQIAELTSKDNGGTSPNSSCVEAGRPGRRDIISASVSQEWRVTKWMVSRGTQERESQFRRVSCDWKCQGLEAEVPNLSSSSRSRSESRPKRPCWLEVQGHSYKGVWEVSCLFLLTLAKWPMREETWLMASGQRKQAGTEMAVSNACGFAIYPAVLRTPQSFPNRRHWTVFKLLSSQKYSKDIKTVADYNVRCYYEKKKIKM